MKCRLSVQNLIEICQMFGEMKYAYRHIDISINVDCITFPLLVCFTHFVQNAHKNSLGFKEHQLHTTHTSLVTYIK
jgi:hypothetical protein